MLYFGMKPPLSFKRFIELSSEYTNNEGLAVLKELCEDSTKLAEPSPIPLIRKFREFEVSLRNELVKLRAARRHLEPHRYMRPETVIEPEIVHLSTRAVRNPSLLDAERELDQVRWNLLDELSFGHYFDLEILIIYGYRLLILERWERIRTADRQRLLEEALTKAGT